MLKIHTNHDSVMLRSNVASSEIASEPSLRNYIDRPLSEQLRQCSHLVPGH